MKHNLWKYKQTSPIQNFKDLDMELERAELHQKFLGEILKNDKELMERAFSLPNLIQSAMIKLTGNSSSDGDANLMDNNLIFIVAKWIMKKLF